VLTLPCSTRQGHKPSTEPARALRASTNRTTHAWEKPRCSLRGSLRGSERSRDLEPRRPGGAELTVCPCLLLADRVFGSGDGCEAGVSCASAEDGERGRELPFLSDGRDRELPSEDSLCCVFRPATRCLCNDAQPALAASEARCSRRRASNLVGRACGARVAQSRRLQSEGIAKRRDAQSGTAIFGARSLLHGSGRANVGPG